METARKHGGRVSVVLSALALHSLLWKIRLNATLASLHFSFDFLLSDEDD